MKSDLLDYKIALEWATKYEEQKFPTKLKEPEKYEEAIKLKRKAKTKFDSLCKEFINKIPD